MEGPISLTQLSEGDKANAVATTVARALSFIPLKGLTSLTTGTFVTDGFGLHRYRRPRGAQPRSGCRVRRYCHEP